VDSKPLPAARPRQSSQDSAWGRALGECWLMTRIAVPYLALAALGRIGLPCRSWRRRLDHWAALTFTRFVRQHGALLIKVGQFIATRPDLFTPAWITACADMRDQAPPKPFSQVSRTLNEAYQGMPPFTTFEPEPLASASFGQVHRATLPDGRIVAVKVQHFGIARLIAIDLRLVRMAMTLLRWVMPGFPFRDLLSELGASARAELDYLQEATSMDRLRPVLRRHEILTPRIVWDHTRASVLVMEYVGGTTLARLDYATLAPEQRHWIARSILDAYLSMLLDAGFYHADPHGGNFIYDQGRLWMIDFGMTASLSRRQAELYHRFLACVQTRDIDGMIEIMLRLGFVLPTAREQIHTLAQRLYESIIEIAPGSQKRSQRRAEIGWAVNEILLQSPGVIFPQHTIMLSRATSMLEGLCAELVPEVSLISLARPLLQKRMTPWLKLRYLLQEAREMWSMLGALPSHLSSLVRPPDHRPVQAIIISAALIGALLLPPGHLRVVAAILAGLAALWMLRRPPA